MTTTPDTAHVVELTNHPAIKMQLDTGALSISEEDPQLILQSFSHLIGHVHASEPDLLPLGDGGTHHSKIYQALSKYLPESLVTIEMVATQREPHLISIERAIQVARQFYQPT